MGDAIDVGQLVAELEAIENPFVRFVNLCTAGAAIRDLFFHRDKDGKPAQPEDAAGPLRSWYATEAAYVAALEYVGGKPPPLAAELYPKVKQLFEDTEMMCRVQVQEGIFFALRRDALPSDMAELPRRMAELPATFDEMFGNLQNAIHSTYGALRPFYLAEARATSTGVSRVKRGERGRKKADYETEQKEAAIAADWERARDSGDTKKDFIERLKMKVPNMTLTKLDQLLDRVAWRKRPVE